MHQFVHFSSFESACTDFNVLDLVQFYSVSSMTAYNNFIPYRWWILIQMTITFLSNFVIALKVRLLSSLGFNIRSMDR